MFALAHKLRVSFLWRLDTSICMAITHANTSHRDVLDGVKILQEKWTGFSINTYGPWVSYFVQKLAMLSSMCGNPQFKVRVNNTTISWKKCLWSVVSRQIEEIIAVLSADNLSHCLICEPGVQIQLKTSENFQMYIWDMYNCLNCPVN